MEQAIATKPAQAALTATTLADLATPCLVLDAERMDRNIARLKARLDGLGVKLRPHLKTCKSVEVARRVMASPSGPATVSTLLEAEQFAAAGVRDVVYAVGIAPSKLPQVLALRARGTDLAVVLDTVEQAQAVARASRQAGTRIPALIEIDCDGHRSGVLPADRQLLLDIGHALQDGAELRGVMTHAGASYLARGAEALRQCAEVERRSVVDAATLLREAGLPCPVVSVGSTPTAHNAADLSGVTEVRAGVFVFFDLVMAGVGVCQVDDIALSVLATVIGHQREKGWILVDAGWMALSHDRGTRRQAVDQGYGLVCDTAGVPYPDLIVVDANQEHGIIMVRPESGGKLPDLAIGDRVRILPNHACATGAQHRAYHVVRGASDNVEAEWPRFGAGDERAGPLPSAHPAARSAEGRQMSAGSLVTGILTDRAPKPAGHYTQAVVSGAHVFVSGQLPIRPEGLPLDDDGFEAQARQAIQNLLEILRAAGSSPQLLLKVTAYIVGIANWPRFNAVYASMLPDARPARSVVPVPELHYGYLVEIDAIAVREP